MVEGVSEVTVVGASQRAIRIVLKPEKLAEYGIAYQTVRSKLNANNYNTPGGKAKNDAMEITVRTLGKYNNINDIKQVVVANHTGRPVISVKLPMCLIPGRMRIPLPVLTVFLAL